jgi:hypothetical protein
MNEQINLNIDYKALIKEKLLDAYEKNPIVLEKILQLKEKANLSEYSKHNYQNIGFFNSYYLAGIVVSLCPEATNFITTALEFNSDLYSVLQTIGLNFDPVEELEKRKEKKRQEQKLISETKNLVENGNESTTVYPEYEDARKHFDEIREQNKQENSS